MRYLRLVVALVFGLAAPTGARAQVHAGGPVTPPWCKPLAAGPAGVQLVRVGAELWVERLEGEAALGHLYNLLSRRPQAFEAARRSLEERGLSATQRVFVERTVRLARGPSGTQVVPAQTHSEQNGEGEIVFWSWSDGNDNTWEGTIYYEVYDTGTAATWDGQIDVSIKEYPWIWYERTWFRDPGPQQAHLSEPPRMGQVALAGLDRLPPMGVVPAGALDWARCWRKCVIAGCTGSAFGCLASNGGWPGCWAAWCVGSEVTCAIACS
ncbi:MAG: hypothetical protein ACRDHY_13820 [Anaerolineales bacterium]